MKKYQRYSLLILIMISCILISLLFYKENMDVKANDISIHDKDKSLYNIGDLTRMPFYYEELDKKTYNENKTEYIVKYINSNKIYHEVYPQSIFSNYIKLLEEKKIQDIELPDIHSLQKATDTFYENNKSKIDKFFNEINNEKTLFVHIRSGDKGHIPDIFINNIKQLESKYEKVVILYGIHNSDADNAINTIIKDFEKFDNTNNKYIFNNSEPDIHLCFFRKCKNLFVSRGGFSALGCLLFEGDKIYYMKNMMNEPGCNYNEQWYTYMNTKQIIYL
jgi:hypothetical protein